MIQISGYVKVQETNLGVPNLVVAAYDAQHPLHEIIDKHKNEKGFVPTLMQHLGYRISSVLTDLLGKFIFSINDLKFEGNESRPNLIIIVFAPEDIVDIRNPVPLPPEERILYLSAVPRNKDRAEEAYRIWLLKEQLDKFNIPYGDPSEAKKPETLICH